ncbi:hypothetical protein [Maribacter sp. Asnod2-G09]|uniref:hypothetical protein n=1 Tax=Maribacter sp. Asnod2-G09 TaxID=3160577 RepID=UPI003868CECD
MKLAVKREKQIVEDYNTWLPSYLNDDVKSYATIFNYNTCFNGTSVKEVFLIRSSTSNFFRTIFELGSTNNLKIND